MHGISLDSDAGKIMAITMGQGVDALDRLKALLRLPSTLPDFAGTSGMTPLMTAAACGNVAAVEVLASHPLVNLRRQDKNGWTALHYAAAGGHAEAVRALLSHQAPVSTATTEGQMPFELAKGKATEDVFWENRDFIRYMKQDHPEHAKFQPEPPVTLESPPAPAPPTKEMKINDSDPLKDAFFRAITSVGLQWKLDPSLNVRAALIQKLAGMKEDELKSSHKTIRNTGASFDWSGVFIAAAGQSNIPAMRFLHDEMLFEQRTLNQALSAAVRKGDNRDVAHHLVIWGANPSAPFEVHAQLKEASIFEAAFHNGHQGIFEELVLWRGDRLSKSDIRGFENFSRARPAGDRHAEAISLYWEKREFKNMKTAKLKDIFSQFVERGRITSVMATYAEAREDRLFRGRVDFAKADGGGAIAVALKNERYEFARLLISHGYHLKHAPEFLKEALRLYGSDKAKQFAADHLAGKMKVEPVEDVGRKKRAELRLLSSPVMYGGHYGRF